MALALSGVAVSAFSGAAAPLTQMRAASVSMAASDDLKSLSKELNPVLGCGLGRAGPAPAPALRCGRALWRLARVWCAVRQTCRAGLAGTTTR